MPFNKDSVSDYLHGIFYFMCIVFMLVVIICCLILPPSSKISALFHNPIQNQNTEYHVNGYHQLIPSSSLRILQVYDNIKSVTNFDALKLDAHPHSNHKASFIPPGLTIYQRYVSIVGQNSNKCKTFNSNALDHKVNKHVVKANLLISNFNESSRKQSWIYTENDFVADLLHPTYPKCCVLYGN